MKAKDCLKSGMMVELRNGDRGLVVGDKIMYYKGVYFYLQWYNEDLLYKEYSEVHPFSIVKVFNPSSFSHFDGLYDKDCWEPLWERKPEKIRIEDFEFENGDLIILSEDQKVMVLKDRKENKFNVVKNFFQSNCYILSLENFIKSHKNFIIKIFRNQELVWEA